jgi:hypothetical protein
MEFVVHRPELYGDAVRVAWIAHEGDKAMSWYHNEYLTETLHDQRAGPVSAPELPRQAIEAHRSQQLPWPRNLFGELASIEELLSEAASPNDTWACGCRGRHRHNVSQTLWNSPTSAVGLS